MVAPGAIPLKPEPAGMVRVPPANRPGTTAPTATGDAPGTGWKRNKSVVPTGAHRISTLASVAGDSTPTVYETRTKVSGAFMKLNEPCPKAEGRKLKASKPKPTRTTKDVFDFIRPFPKPLVTIISTQLSALSRRKPCAEPQARQGRKRGARILRHPYINCLEPHQWVLNLGKPPWGRKKKEPLLRAALERELIRLLAAAEDQQGGRAETGESHAGGVQALEESARQILARERCS
jgi:hypothetical protein